jgi:hypothetical protein
MGIIRYTENTITNIEELEKELKKNSRTMIYLG